MPRAVIVGGGIGGLTTAIALSRKGWEVTVCEAADRVAPVGKGIWVPTNAMMVLERLGLARRIAEAGSELGLIQIRNRAGRLLSSVDLGGIRARFGHTTVSIARDALVRVLEAALPPGSLELGKRLRHVEALPSGVRAVFHDGSDMAGDLLVGADGIRSVTREAVEPGVALRYSGQTCYRGIADITLPPTLATTVWEVWGGRHRFGFSSIGPGRVYWFAPVTAPAGGNEGGSQAAAALRGWYAAFPSPIPEILAATPAEDIIRTDLLDFAPISRWHAGNIVLVGDAAHAMTPNLGQGGAQAIEDGYALAEQLGGGLSIGAALDQYERVRMTKARWIVNTARRFGQVAHWEHSVACWVRDTMLACTPASANRGPLDRLYGLNY